MGVIAKKLFKKSKKFPGKGAEKQLDIKVKKQGGITVILADHGNADERHGDGRHLAGSKKGDKARRDHEVATDFMNQRKPHLL